ncbi:hypothetical protein [Geoalkalibacter sp.]|uniref:hypothetical protein n=1 Tax=Geoalkalibacter sp. TaxID=3041440 RepID=UPI00272EE4C1|nr:hypothetical protein [Geoalkalibacter sp.]
MKIFPRTWLPTLLMLLLTMGCAPKSLTPEKDLLDTLGRFTQDLRWNNPQGAARFFAEDQRRNFLERYQGREGLNITDVQVTDIRFNPDRSQAEVAMRLEYYQLPSASVRRQDLRQTWRVEPGVLPGPGSWRLHTPFPDLP